MIAGKINPPWAICRSPAPLRPTAYGTSRDGSHSPEDAAAGGKPEIAGSNRRVGRGRFATGIALGLLLGIALMFAALMWGSRNTTPRLTQADLDAAVARWESGGPKNYNLDLDLFGNRPSQIHVEVRGGQVTHMTRDGIEPKRRPTWYYWSVTGQLDTIGQELEKAGDPVGGFHAPAGSRVIQRALFDPEYGYPIEYHRIILGSDLEIRWQVTRFKVVGRFAVESHP